MVEQDPVEVGGPSRPDRKQLGATDSERGMGETPPGRRAPAHTSDFPACQEEGSAIPAVARDISEWQVPMNLAAHCWPPTLCSNSWIFGTDCVSCCVFGPVPALRDRFSIPLSLS